MSFISFEFVFFFIVVVALYFRLSHRLGLVFMLGASYFFYGYWNVAYLGLILFSTVVDYSASLMMGRLQERNSPLRLGLLLASIATNLGVLFTFKYFNFFAAAASDLSAVLGLGYAGTSLAVLLPVGISFYTFQSMAYTIDVYRRKIPIETNFLVFALYVAYFPQLVAGPIERAQNIIPQLKVTPVFDYERAVSGLRLMLWGAFKKIAISDRIAPFVNAVYDDPASYGGLTLVAATLGFAIQIYCDFSGYSDIAIGAARILGIDLMQNFRQPYFATSLRDFWRRWHISLSTWFRDYVYFPLGGSRVTLARNMLNLLIVFLVSGLWHGANWTFVIWGFIHGTFIVLDLWLVQYAGVRRVLQRLRLLHIPVTFGIVVFAWIFFRANSLDDAMTVLNGLARFNGITEINTIFADTYFFPFTLEVMLLALVGVIWLVNDYLEARTNTIGLGYLVHVPRVLRWTLYYVLSLLIIITLIFGSTEQQFIYFQF